MNYNENLAKVIIEQLGVEKPVILISIVSLQGSSPRHHGTKMVVGADGKSYGTIGGSLLEATAIKETRDVLLQKQSRIMNFNLDGTNVYATGMICGGKTVLLLDYIAATVENQDYFKEWQDALSSRVNFFFLTHLKEGENNVSVVGRGILFSDGNIIGNCLLAPADVENLKAKTRDILSTTVLTVSNGSLIIDPMRKLKTLFCFGAGHVALPTAHIAALAGFRVVVLDDRTEYANTERFPDADDIRVFTDYNHALEGLEIDRDSYVVIFTRGHQYDREVLERALKTSAGYVGMISSRRRLAIIYEALLSNGIKKERLEWVHSPIGIDIGGETPEEIAISIVAELIKVRSEQTS